MIGPLAAGLLAVSTAAPPGPAWHFVDVAAEVGLAGYRLHAGSAEKRVIPEAMPGGVAWLDFDLDGDWDLFLVQGGSAPPPRAGTRADFAGPPPALFRNELVETGAARFTDVTHEVGLGDAGRGHWGMGVTAADPDGDGDPDLLLTGLGPDRFYRNDVVREGRRSGRAIFTEVGAALGLDDAGWSTGAALADVDGDGDLDLFVAGYVDFDPAFVPPNETFTHWRGVTVFPGPVGLAPARDRFHRNLLVETGRLAFRDATEEAGLAVPEPGYGFAALFVDHDGDGDPDLHVANDSTPNRLFRNDGSGRFTEVGFVAGVAYSEDGKMQAGMGMTAGDCNGDGRADLFVTNFAYDYFALHRGADGGRFDDVSYASGLGTPTFHVLGFGALFLDADRDGDEDLFVANGHIYPQVADIRFATTYAQANQLFENVGACRFAERTRAAGPGLALERVSRGAAACDFDLDGDLDVVVNELDAAPTLLRNDSAPRGGWLGVALEGCPPNGAGIGARVTVEAVDMRQVREVRTSDSYLSSPPPVAWFGLGPARTVTVRVRFRSGREVVRRGVPAGATVTVREREAGGGCAPRPAAPER